MTRQRALRRAIGVLLVILATLSLATSGTQPTTAYAEELTPTPTAAQTSGNPGGSGGGGGG